MIGRIGLALAVLALAVLGASGPAVRSGLVSYSVGILMIAEVFLPSFGAIGVGGIVAFVLGSLLLIEDTELPGFEIPYALIAGAAAASAGFLILMPFRSFVWAHQLTAERAARGAVKSRLSLGPASFPCGHAGADSGGSSSRAGDSTLDSAVSCPAWPHLQKRRVYSEKPRVHSVDAADLPTWSITSGRCFRAPTRNVP